MGDGGDDFDQTFKPTANPFARKPNAPPVKKVRQYALPDPSKKQAITNDTPIKVNPTGQYNLNFIDWNNEWERVMERDLTTFESPIYGMDDNTFEKIFDEEMFDEMKKRNGMRDDFIGELDTKKVNKTKKD